MEKIPKIVAYGAFDETVCTAPLGPKYICLNVGGSGAVILLQNVFKIVFHRFALLLEIVNVNLEARKK